MPSGLKRYQQAGDLHFVTFSCYHRGAYLDDGVAKETFEHSLEAMRLKYRFVVLGYVVMPEHVHLHLTARPFWQRRYYDFNVYTSDKRTENWTICIVIR